MKKFLLPMFVFLLSFVIISPVAGQSGDHIIFSDNPLKISNTVVTIVDLLDGDYFLTWDNDGRHDFTYSFEPVEINIYVKNFLELEEVTFVLHQDDDILQTRILPVSSDPFETNTPVNINFDFIGDSIDLIFEFWYVVIIFIISLTALWFIRRGH